jgi:hypothetical protein
MEKRGNRKHVRIEAHSLLKSYHKFSIQMISLLHKARLGSILFVS